MIKVNVYEDVEHDYKHYDALIVGEFKFEADDIEDFDVDAIVEELGQSIRDKYKHFVDWKERNLKWLNDHAEYCLKGSKHASSYSPDYGEYE